jgi:hypothetical protein
LCWETHASAAILKAATGRLHIAYDRFFTARGTLFGRLVIVPADFVMS